MERGFSKDEWLLPFAHNDLVDRNIYKVSIDWIFHIDYEIPLSNLIWTSSAFLSMKFLVKP